MGDPLSIVSGVAGIISLAIQVTGTCYTYGCAAKGAPAEVDSLLTEIMALSGVLSTISSLLELEKPRDEKASAGLVGFSDGDEGCESLPPPSYSLVVEKDRFKELEGPLKGATAALEEVQAALKKAEMTSEKRLGKLIKMLKWPFKQDQTMALLRRLERYKNLFVLALASSRAGVEVDDRETLHEIRNQQLLDRLERQVEKQDAQFQSFNRWLCPLNCADAHRAAQKLRLKGTGRWMQDSPLWKSWLEADRTFLWLYGIPGSGKTVLTSTLLEQCYANTQPNQTFLTYFYCDFRQKESQAAETVLGALICQLCSQFGAMPPGVQSFANAHRSTDGQFDQPTLEELETLLLYLFHQAPAAIVVIDALDECTNRESLLLLLEKLPSLDKCNVKVLVSSRQEGDIESAFAKFDRQSTRVLAVDHDIDAYILSSIQRSSRLQRLSPELKETVVSTLKQEAHGMFRWVQCQIETLNQLRTDRDIRRALTRLPHTLNETYERILTRIADADAEVARRALLWLAYAPRLLTLTELAEAVVIEPDTTARDPEAAWFPPDLLLVIGSLARYSPDDDVIVLAHHSVKEFLESPDLSPANARRFAVQRTAGDIEIARTCLTYILMDDFANGPCDLREAYQARCEEYSLLPYAARYWPFHAKTDLASSHPTLELACRLLHPSRTPSFWSWLETVIAQGPYSYRVERSGISKSRGNGQRERKRASHRFFERVPRQLTPLYYAASFGLTPVVAWLLEQDRVAVNEIGGMLGGTPLHAAIYRRHHDVMALLLDAGANAAAEDRSRMTPLQMAQWMTRDTNMARILARKQREQKMNQELKEEVENTGDVNQEGLSAKIDSTFAFFAGSLIRDT